MTALTKGRNTVERIGDNRDGGLAEGEVAFQGALIARNAAGFLVAGVEAAGLIGVGRAEDAADNSSGADGDVSLRYRMGCFRYVNSAGADEIGIADIGSLAFIVDDQTVARTDGGTSRSPAGTVDGVDTLGVWVRFDEPLTNAAVA